MRGRHPARRGLPATQGAGRRARDVGQSAGDTEPGRVWTPHLSQAPEAFSAGAEGSRASPKVGAKAGCESGVRRWQEIGTYTSHLRRGLNGPGSGSRRAVRPGRARSRAASSRSTLVVQPAIPSSASFVISQVFYKRMFADACAGNPRGRAAPAPGSASGSGPRFRPPVLAPVDPPLPGPRCGGQKTGARAGEARSGPQNVRGMPMSPAGRCKSCGPGESSGLQARAGASPGSTPGRPRPSAGGAQRTQGWITPDSAAKGGSGCGFEELAGGRDPRPCGVA